MSFVFRLSPTISLGASDRISPADATRQEQTAQELLSRLSSQPGIILADEVGMGKTFVALAVAASVAQQDPAQRPVVIMIPGSLRAKWPRDFSLFQERCLKGQRLRAELADKPIEFLKLLEDKGPTRPNIIFLTHNALARHMGDGWVKLAMIRQALYRRHDVDDIRHALSRFAGKLLRMDWVERHSKTNDTWGKLLATDPREWGHILQNAGIHHASDGESAADKDPVPDTICQALTDTPTDELRETLRMIPRRASPNLETYLAAARKEIDVCAKHLWKSCIENLKLSLPLLILDEAHHAKNAHTRLARLFDDPEAMEVVSKGILCGAFSRMVFLTATPFQLGHHELCNVLERFHGIRWSGPEAPGVSREGYDQSIQALRASLDHSQTAALGLDAAWGKLSQSDLATTAASYKDTDSWWSAVSAGEAPATEHGRQVHEHFRNALAKLGDAEQRLQPWIVRHLRDRTFESSGALVHRRERHSGQTIIPNVAHLSATARGISIDGEAILPFLLAARAVAQSPSSRPVFAEGLASSFEAFLHTRVEALAALPSEDTALDTDDKVDDGEDPKKDTRTRWYLDQIAKIVPAGSTSASLTHPKVSATVARVIDLWQQGEKVVVFCHYRATGKILRQAISTRMQQITNELAADAMGCSPQEAPKRLEEIGERFDRDSLRKAIDAAASALIAKYPDLLPHKEDLLQIVRRNLRTPSFLVRYYPLREDLPPDEAISQALATRDGSRLTLEALLDAFFDFLAKRCGEKDRQGFIEACRKITPGAHTADDISSSFSEDEASPQERTLLLPNVRLANGSSKPETRERLMLAFNTPFYPDVLIASSIMAEGVDLHLNCRHVIHHDLCWNPSSLEQRTGRIDRIGCKMEKSGVAIQVFLPFVAETQDEKMFHVVMDREQWFNVIMGDKVKTSLASTDALAQRLPLPQAAVESLKFDFSVGAAARKKHVA